MTITEIVTAFQTPITTFPNGLVIQKILLSKASSVNTELAANRCLGLLEETELRALLLSLYPSFSFDETTIGDVASITEIKAALVPYQKFIIKAVNELRFKIPSETLELLKDFLVKESPLYYVAVAIFVVTTMVLIEAGEL